MKRRYIIYCVLSVLIGLDAISMFLFPRMQGSIDKPVLYLYPEEDISVKVSFKNPSFLTTTYPKYNGGWNVFVDKSGNINDGKNNYYALYWEEKATKKESFKEGFYVEKDNAIEFLEEKLSIIGLNDRERNEFIMYWLPILEDNNKSLVHFELTDEKQKTNELIIDPKPDSLLRVTMHVKKVNKKTNIKEQTLKTFNRVGFTAVEWGGIVE